MLSRLDVRELYERSKDGKSNRWDKVGEIVKILRYVSTGGWRWPGHFLQAVERTANRARRSPKN